MRALRPDRPVSLLEFAPEPEPAARSAAEWIGIIAAGVFIGSLPAVLVARLLLTG